MWVKKVNRVRDKKKKEFSCSFHESGKENYKLIELG